MLHIGKSGEVEDHRLYSRESDSLVEAWKMTIREIGWIEGKKTWHTSKTTCEVLQMWKALLEEIKITWVWLNMKIARVWIKGFE